MKIAGWTLLVFGCLSLLGYLLKEGQFGIGPLTFIALGMYFIHVANQKKEDKEKKKQWEDGK